MFIRDPVEMEIKETDGKKKTRNRKELRSQTKAESKACKERRDLYLKQFGIDLASKKKKKIRKPRREKKNFKENGKN